MKQAFIVTADLWMEDESTDRNLVLISSIPSSRTLAYTQQYSLRIMLEDTTADNEVSDGTQRRLQEDPSVPDSGKLHHSDTDQRHHQQKQSSKTVPTTERTDSRQSHRGPGDEDTEMEEDEEAISDNAIYVEQELREIEEYHRLLKNSVVASTTIASANESETETRATTASTSTIPVSLPIAQLAAYPVHELSTRNLVGQTAVSGQIAPQPEGEDVFFWFAFSILSIRTEGYFKIRFCLTDLTRIPDGGKTPIICEVFSDTIHVQTPKKFEGTC
ncbi:hypothetical protein BGW38_007638, partial [Lunasporangiospora selenospora]